MNDEPIHGLMRKDCKNDGNAIRGQVYSFQVHQFNSGRNGPRRSRSTASSISRAYSILDGPLNPAIKIRKQRHLRDSEVEGGKEIAAIVNL